MGAGIALKLGESMYGCVRGACTWTTYTGESLTSGKAANLLSLGHAAEYRRALLNEVKLVRLSNEHECLSPLFAPKVEGYSACTVGCTIRQYLQNSPRGVACEGMGTPAFSIKGKEPNLDNRGLLIALQAHAMC